MANANETRRNGNAYTNAALTAIALLLGALVLRGESTEPMTQPAYAAAPVGFPNAADQRNKMIQAIEKVEKKLGSIETKLNKMGPFDVKVLSMPAAKE